jgi:uncharacterized protein (TIGR03435 family)
VGKSFLRTGSALLLAAAVGFSQNAPRPTFEVASVKPSPPLPPDLAGGLAQLGSSGVKINPARAEFIRVSLTDLIARAYRVGSFQISGPDWMKTAHFDIFAKLPDGASPDSVPEMLQSLLADRFKLTLQRAEKEFPVYVLIVAKGGSNLPRKPSDYDPQAKNSAGPMTMEFIATLLSNAVGRPVLNQTEMEGEYMVPHEFRSAMGRRILARRVAHGGDEPELTAAMSVPSDSEFFGALKALGLSLEPRKLPLTSLVIDHLERTPTDN